MSFLVVSCVYYPEPVVSAMTSSQVADGLALAGHKATVVTSFPSRPGGRLYAGYRRRFLREEDASSGLKIIRCFSTLSSESRITSRLLDNLSFGLTSGWQVLTMGRPGVMYANTWPIVAMGILVLVAKIRRVPLVISVQDMYPESLIEQRRIKDNAAIAQMLRWIDGVIARSATHVIVISERFAKAYLGHRRVNPDRLSVISNWIDSGQIEMCVSGREFRQRLGIRDDVFLVVYGGNIGVASGVQTLIEAFGILQDCPNVKLLIAGSGSQLGACRKLAKEIPGERILFHSPWAAGETSEVLRAADLLALPTQGRQSTASVPSKLLSYMLAGRPVLASGVTESDLAEIVADGNCGWVVQPDRPDLLAKQVEAIMRINPSERQKIGENGRKYVLAHFSKDVCLPKVIDVIKCAARH